MKIASSTDIHPDVLANVIYAQVHGFISFLSYFFITYTPGVLHERGLSVQTADIFFNYILCFLGFVYLFCISKQKCSLALDH